MGHRVEQEFLHEHARVALAFDRRLMSVFAPDSQCRMRESDFGSTVTGIALIRRVAVDDRRQTARRAMPPRLVLALVAPFDCLQC